MVSSGTVIIIGVIIAALAVGGTALSQIKSAGKDIFNRKPSEQPKVNNISVSSPPSSSNPSSINVDNPRSNTTETIIQRILTIPPIDDRPSNPPIPVASEIAQIPNAKKKSSFFDRASKIPNNIKFSTSLPNAPLVTGEQLKREEPVVITNAKSKLTSSSSRLQTKIVEEQNRASKIFASLFGNVQNPEFGN